MVTSTAQDGSCTFQKNATNQPSDIWQRGHFSGLQAVNFLVASCFIACIIFLSSAFFITFTITPPPLHPKS